MLLNNFTKDSYETKLAGMFQSKSALGLAVENEDLTMIFFLYKKGLPTKNIIQYIFGIFSYSIEVEYKNIIYFSNYSLNWISRY